MTLSSFAAKHVWFISLFVPKLRRMPASQLMITPHADWFVLYLYDCASFQLSFINIR